MGHEGWKKKKGRRVKRVVRAMVLPTHDQSQVRHREKDSPAVPKAKAKADAGPTPMEVDPPEVQPKKSWVAIAVEGARPSAKAKTTPSPKASGVPAPKAEPKGKQTPVPEAKSAQAPRAESKETKRADPKVEVKKERGAESMLPAIVGARLKSKRGKENLVGIQRCLQRNQRSGRHRRDPTMLTAGQERGKWR